MSWRDDLRAFGAEVDRLTVLHAIEVGGFIAPGGEVSGSSRPGREEEDDARKEGQGSGRGPAAGSRSRLGEPAGPRAGAAIEAIRRRVSTSLEFGGLVELYPRLRELPSPSGSNFSYLKIPVGVFRALPRDAVLVFEIPHDGPREPVAGLPRQPDGSAVSPWRTRWPIPVPDIRVWAFWSEGLLVNSFHQYPDRSACVHMVRGPRSWVWGLHPFKLLVHWSVFWIAKELYEREFGRWPGLHHCSGYIRALRDKPNEWCGCGRVEGKGDADRYRNHCRPEDMRKTPIERCQHFVVAQKSYLTELRRRGRSRRPPFAWW